MKAGALSVQAEAKERIGHYQAEMGPFPEWPLLASSTVAEKRSLGYADAGNDNPLLRTGDMRDSIYAWATPAAFIVGSHDPIALYQEMGTEHIPPRPFLGPALYKMTPYILTVMGKAVESTIAGKP